MGLFDSVNDFIGSATGGLLSDFGGSLLQNQWNKDASAKSREWQTDMSNTAYQRAVVDMKKAGLNPLLMIGSGKPATTGSGGGYQAGKPELAKGTQSGASTALSLAMASKERALGESASVQAKLDTLKYRTLLKNPALLESMLTGQELKKGGRYNILGAVSSAWSKFKDSRQKPIDRRLIPISTRTKKEEII